MNEEQSLLQPFPLSEPTSKSTPLLHKPLLRLQIVVYSMYGSHTLMLPQLLLQSGRSQLFHGPFIAQKILTLSSSNHHQAHTTPRTSTNAFIPLLVLPLLQTYPHTPYQTCTSACNTQDSNSQNVSENHHHLQMWVHISGLGQDFGLLWPG